MSATWTVCRRELGAHLASPAIWAATVLLVVLLHTVFFVLGHPVQGLELPAFWEGGEASLRTFFAWLPLALVFAAPALTMGVWAEERRAGTDELLLTAPLPIVTTVVGKFLAAWLVLVAALACATLPLALTVASLGELDWGVVVTGFVGALLLAASTTAVGLAASALAREQLSAFASGVTFLGLLWAIGVFVRALPAGLARGLAELSLVAHFLEGPVAGVLDLRDFVYHGLLVVLALGLNGRFVAARRFG